MSEKIMEMIKENDISFVDLLIHGKMHHVTQHIAIIKEALEEGFMFDGSSIGGWKAINESDMTICFIYRPILCIWPEGL